jgi:hypothetical protein
MDLRHLRCFTSVVLYLKSLGTPPEQQIGAELTAAKRVYVHSTENREECTFHGERVTIKGEMILVKVGV